MDNIVVGMILTALTLVVIYVNVAHRKRRASMTKAEREAEDERMADWKF